MAACPRCGEANPDRARFCLACGTPLQSQRAAGQVRKTVTVLFADIKDSTPLGERLDPEATRSFMNRYFADVQAVIERHGGTVEKFIGDAVMAVFGTPAVHEDDPLRAVRAATEMRSVLGTLNAELEQRWGFHVSIRTGINTGKVVAGDPATGSTFVTGDAVNVAARLEQTAQPGQILIGDPTYRLVRDAVLVEPVEPLELKGKTEPMTAWRVLGVVSGAPAVARRLDSPLVGRERELTMLEQAFERAAADGTCQLVTILGPAGAGKSRLAQELLDRVDQETTVLVGRCLPYGDGITFWPIVEIVKRAAGVGAALSADEARERLVSVLADDPEAGAVAERLLGLLAYGDAPGGANEIFWAVRRLLQALARRRPVVVLFEDVHWGEETFLDVVDHIVDWGRDSPILLICLARPELLEGRADWAAAKLNSTSLMLEPLGDEACEDLIENLLDGAQVAPEVTERIARSAEGNPLYVEELLAMLIEDGSIRQDDGFWVPATDLSSLAIPPTIQAVLDARFDQLPAGDRALLERAAVAGRAFSRAAVRVLSPPEEHASVADRLDDLMRKQLIRPHHTDTGKKHTYRFRHSLIREAAYRQMPKGTRADLHERFAEWLEGSGEPRSAEEEEILGFHLEQAHRFATQVAGDNERTKSLGVRAAERLSSAGRTAFARGDMPAAVALLTRAILLRDDELEQARVAADLGAALIEVGELEQADGLLERMAERAGRSGDRRLEAHLKLARLPAQLRLASGRGEDALRIADEALAVFWEADDELGLAEAWRRIGDVHWLASNWQARSDALEQARAHARRAGNRREEADIMASLGLSYVWGPMPAEEGITRLRALLEEITDDPILEAHVIGDQAGLEAMLGHFDEARDSYARSVGIFRDRGLKRALGAQTSVAGELELLAGDPHAAEIALLEGIAIAEQTGNVGSLATLGALLAEALYLQDRLAEALGWTERAEVIAASDDIASQVLWRSVRARILARRGQGERGAKLAHDAVALAAQTDAINLHAGALTSLAEVRRVAEEDGSGLEALTEAVRLYEQKQNLVSAERTRALLPGAA